MTEWKLSADEVVAMPLDELAMRVLEDARDTDEWHWRNWLGRVRGHAWPEDPTTTPPPVVHRGADVDLGQPLGCTSTPGRWLQRRTNQTVRSVRTPAP